MYHYNHQVVKGEMPKNVKESSTHASYHVMVEVDSNSKSLKGEPGEAPQAFEKRGKPLYRLNLGTNEDLKPIYVSLLLSPS